MSAEADQSPRSPSRRNFIRLLGVAGGTAVAGVGSQATPLSPVQNGQAVACGGLCIAGGAAVGGVALGWALREFEVVGSDSPPEGLTGDALQNDVYTTARTRKSTNTSTILDNENIVESGLANTAWADGKIAAIDALNEQQTESEVLSVGRNKVNDYLTTVLKNLLKTWNEAVDELYTMKAALEDHSDLSVKDSLSVDGTGDVQPGKGGTNILSKKTTTYQLPDGSDFEVKSIDAEYRLSDGGGTGAGDAKFDPTSPSGGSTAGVSTGDLMVWVNNPAGDAINYLEAGRFNDVLTTIEDVQTQVNDGLSNWVTKIYDEVQSGELDTSELLTPREQAKLTSDDEDFPQAIADLEALNVAVDYERQATIHIPDDDSTLVGRLSYSGDKSFSVGQVDPDATDDNGDPIYPGSIYFTYDLAEGSGDWSEYETGIDGGVLTFTAEPYQNTRYTVQTVAGESAEVAAGDFTHDDTDGVWTIDLSDQLDTAITDVEYVDYAADVDGTKYETIQLTETFEIKSFTNTETGEEHEQTNFERSEPQTDDNYITEEEWKQQQERHEELIEKYENAQGGVGIDLGQFDMFGLPGEVVALVAAGLAVLGISN